MLKLRNENFLCVRLRMREWKWTRTATMDFAQSEHLVSSGRDPTG
jgi:hypothetical protein